MPFIVNTDRDRDEMLRSIGAASFDDLIPDIPEEVRLKRSLDLFPALSEPEVMKLLEGLSSVNRSAAGYVSFLGGGAYDHFIPSAIKSIVSRSEFYTAYTPYQAEVSQGTLQAIYEYQSMMCRLYGMDVANASMYDGATALAEAVLMAMNITGREQVVIAGKLNPYAESVLKTYLEASGSGAIVRNQLNDGTGNIDGLRLLVSDRTAAIVVQQPNFYGCLEDVDAIGAAARECGALFIVSADPVSLGTLEAPGNYGADIAVGEGQPLGNHQNFGGPYLGIFTVSQAYVRKIPGRLVGMTRDRDGNDGFILTLQTREQHIRREKATSNICTNQALCALQAAVYLSLLGKQGISEVAGQCAVKAHYLADRIASIPGYSMKFTTPFFREFAVETPVPASGVISAMLDEGIFAGYDLSLVGESGLLVAVTEKRTRAELDRFVTLLGRL
ncbi:MAG: aminomethyl-transferring glycine dehydrogenase subunit GcvPA [Chlorobium sp.]|jgi:glycine dehydrogenase subunit 1|uniref:aminomethyl-transferring glycine dehydrogenase subunit GcvPA n=1 Tax=Chlorobium sp. TaxID=1095 RepID=UPI0025C25B78|nr:aminomethyl-transferring glycine dehydrogenase subunit GcvPA [Chlorobium sp.]MCF8215902.1 aminomethyl-transferring glycine dehydrogenase subunit GcvPA [Chlorobium sp.]MCF8270800.1 aminomethyl-transferring glycine dehydrogenase subunit GcvPA [Chlorobium sp.]MCF8287112.1 aminomethyl-transferring glycine dehydrogenase subunit GcvPA [Chlorobium sp.]MCF8290769.1 aminomethyl-transferring glycine dehydrogenase subunit GcvPA [Chlorobium sp.]MCF8384873.1 aminomethyl-transferring glycine dehydrogenas